MTPLQRICQDRLLRQPPPSIPSPAPGATYLVECACQEASRQLSFCRRATDRVKAAACAAAARDAANVTASRAADVRGSHPGTDESREAKRLADEASDYATQAAEHVEALEVMARGKVKAR